MNPIAVSSQSQETPTTSGESLPSDARGSLSLSLTLPGYHHRMSAEEKEKHLIALGLTTLEEIKEFARGLEIGNSKPQIRVRTDLFMASSNSLDSSTSTDTEDKAASQLPDFFESIAERVKIKKRTCTEPKGAA